MINVHVVELSATALHYITMLTEAYIPIIGNMFIWHCFLNITDIIRSWNSAHVLRNTLRGTKHGMLFGERSPSVVGIIWETWLAHNRCAKWIGFDVTSCGTYALVIIEIERVFWGGGGREEQVYCCRTAKFVDVQYEGFYPVLLVVRGNYIYNYNNYYNKRWQRHVELFVKTPLL